MSKKVPPPSYGSRTSNPATPRYEILPVPSGAPATPRDIQTATQDNLKISKTP